MNRLEERDPVWQEGPCWTTGDVSSLREAVTFHSTAAVLDDQLGEQGLPAWLAAADDGDPTEHDAGAYQHYDAIGHGTVVLAGDLFRTDEEAQCRCERRDIPVRSSSLTATAVECIGPERGEGR